MAPPELVQRDFVDDLNDDFVWMEGAATVTEAADWLRCSRRSVFRMIEKGTIDSRLVLGRRLVAVSSLRRILPAPSASAARRSSGSADLRGDIR